MRQRPRWDGTAQTAGALRDYVLNREQFQRVREAWARVDNAFDALLDAYNKHKNKKRNRTGEVLSWEQWTQKSLRRAGSVGEEEAQMTAMLTLGPHVKVDLSLDITSSLTHGIRLVNPLPWMACDFKPPR